MNAIHIDQDSEGVTVWVFRDDRWKADASHRKVTRSSLIRAQRMQLKLFDQMKGQSPDGELEQQNQTTA